jgi:hypothetical protein
MKSWQLPIAVVVMSLLSTSGKLEAASIRVTIDNESVDVPLHYEYYPDRPGGYYEIGEYENQPFDWATSEGRITLGGTLDPDPSLIFGSVAFDFGAPSIFGYTFILPLLPNVSNPSFVSDSFSGSVTNGPNPQPDGGVTVTALAPPAIIPVDGDGITEMQVYTLSDDGMATWKNVGLDVGLTEFVPLPPFNSGLTATYNEGPIATIPHVPAGAWTHMRADINFGLSGGGDIFTFNGAKILVPEPSTLILAAMFVGAFYCRRLSVR